MNIEQLRNNIDKISDSELEKIEKSKQTQIKPCEQNTLEFYYYVINKAIEDTIKNSKKYGAWYKSKNHFLFNKECAKKQINCPIKQKCGIPNIFKEGKLCPKYYDFYLANFGCSPKEEEKIILFDLFIKLLENHPYSAIFSKIQKQPNILDDLVICVTSDLESIKRLKCIITEENLGEREKINELALIGEYQVAKSKSKQYTKRITKKN